MQSHVMSGVVARKAFYIGIAAAFASYIGLFGWATPVKAVESQKPVAAVSEVPQTLSAGNVFVSNGSTDKKADSSGPDATDGGKQVFVISAYYSPIPGQARYVTGSYAGDIHLNGGGVHGADGTAVHPGMIAAPKGYAFGTKMDIPGLGIVAVHDRGGAIVHSGERGNSHDRLDVWMGYGDAGRTRALKWGKRTVEVTVLGIRPDIAEEIDLVGYSPTEKYAVANTLTFDSGGNFGGNNGSPVVNAPVISSATLAYGAKGGDVSKMQDVLKKLNYYQGDVNGVFDDATLKAVKKFQVSEKIVGGEQDYGAGFVGPKTIKVLAMRAVSGTSASASETITKADAFTRDLKSGDSGADVVRLQQELKKINLLGIEPTGNYGQVTAHAVLKFQQTRLLAGDENSPGAGLFGPITRAALNKLVAERELTEKMIADRKKDDHST